MPCCAVRELRPRTASFPAPAVSPPSLSTRGRHGKPEIFNADQGSQFTSEEFVSELERREIRISMNGRGKCRDYVNMERFWWALKFEDLKIKEYVYLPQLRFGVQHNENFCNAQRLHAMLGYKTPDVVYFGA